MAGNDRYVPYYRNINVTDGVSVHYIEAGSVNNPTVLLLHGFPASSNQYRDLIPLLSDSYHVLAPDLPGFGLTTVPANFKYTFNAMAAVVSAWLVALNVTKFAMYIFDYGAPVGLRLALQNPKQVAAIVSQNGNAYNEGFGHPFWDPIFSLWNNSNDAADREYLAANYLTVAGTEGQYQIGFPAQDLALVDPVQAQLDYLSNIQSDANTNRQLDIFYDYRTNVQLYPKFQQYFRESQVPLLAIWGKGDIIFVPPGAEAFKRDLPNAVVKFVDAGHFALETKRWEIAEAMLKFFRNIGYGRH